MNDGRVRWHEDFRETAGDTGSETGELGWEQRRNQHRIRQIGINKEVVNLDGERRPGEDTRATPGAKEKKV